MAADIRSFPWETTPLGPISTWPPELQAIVSFTLANAMVASVAIGPERIFIYNDRLAQIYGARHPGALGKSLPEIWPEGFRVIAPHFDRAFAGETVHLTHVPHDTSVAGGEVFDLYLTPVWNSSGKVFAVQIAGYEVGARLQSDRLLRESEDEKAYLLRLSDALRPLGNPVAIQETAAMVLGSYLKVSRVAYGEMDVDDEHLSVWRNYVEPGVPLLVGSFRIQDFGTNLVSGMMADRTMVIANITEAEQLSQEERKAHLRMGIHAFVAVPLTKNGRLVAAFVVSHASVRDWTMLEIRLIEATAERTWAAVERAHVEAALVEREESYRTLFQSIDEGFCVIEMLFDGDGNPFDYRFLEGNEAFETQTGLVDVIGRTARQLLPDLEQSWFDRYGAVATTGSGDRFEMRAATMGRWFEVYASRIGGTDSRRVALVFRDISERKRTERALSANVERQDFLLRLSDALAQSGDAQTLNRAAMGLLRTYLAASRVCFLNVRDDMLRLEADVAASDAAPLPAGDEGIFPLAFVERHRWNRLLFSTDTDIDPDISDEERMALARFGGKAFVCIPLTRAGLLVGALMVVSEAPREWQVEELDLVREVADRAWAAGERAGAEVDLRESEGRLRAILETAQDYAIMTTDPHGIVETWSRGALTVLGWTTEEIVGQSISVTFTPEDIAQDVPEWERRTSFDRGQAPDVRWHLRKDGTRVFIEGTIRPLFNSGGELTGYVKVGQDVTERRATEARLRASEGLFRQFAETSTDVIWIRNADSMQFEYVSPAFETIYGDEREHLARENDFRHWLGLILPEDRASVLAAFRRVRGGERVTHEFRIRRPSDGGIRWIRDTDFPLSDGQGNVARLAGIGQDVTKLKHAQAAIVESELRLRTLTEGIPQLVWRAVGYGHWNWASPQWTTFTGQSEEDSHGLGWLDTIHPSDRAAAMDAWDKARATGTFEAEFRVREGETGSYRWFQSRATQVVDEKGNLIEWLGTTTDVQDLREMQDRLHVLVAELQHRTRNLMAVVLGVFRRTRRGKTDLAAFAADFESRVDALARVQGHLSRLDEGDRVVFDELIRAELGAMGALDQDGWGEQVTLDGPPNLRLRSSTVQTLSLALHELATNAVKYGALSTKDGRLEVRWARVEAADKPYLQVDWIESGVKMNANAGLPGGGYGRELIERALPMQLGAETTFELGSDGVRCRITLPLSVNPGVQHA